MLQKLNITKRQLILTALLIATFMLPFVANISTADVLGNYECYNKDRRTHITCLRQKLDSTPYGLTVPKGKNGLGKYGCGRIGGNKTNDTTLVNSFILDFDNPNRIGDT